MSADASSSKDTLQEVKDLIAKGEPKKALELVESFLKANAGGVSTKPLVARATVLKAEAHMHLSDFDNAKDSCEKAIALSKQVRDPSIEAEALRILGNMCWKKGDFKPALEYLRKALDISIGLKDLCLEGKVRNDLGMALSHTGELSSSERELREAILVLEKAGDIHELSRAYNNLGVTIMVARNFERAAQMFAKSKKLAERIGDLTKVAFGALNRAECLIELDKAPEALEELNLALPIVEHIGNNYARMAVITTFGLAYAKMKEWTRAEGYMHTAQQLAKELSMPLAEAMIMTNLGRVYKWRGDKKKAMQLFKEAKDIFEKLGAKTNVQVVLEEMGE